MKKSISILFAAMIGVSTLLGGCSGSASQTGTETTLQSEDASSESEAPSEESAQSEASSQDETTAAGGSASSEASEASGDGTAIRVGALKGPTSMGLAELQEKAGKGETANQYTFTMEGAADTLVGEISEGSLDIALVPANVASVLYNKTEGGVTVIDINTLGVLYAVSSSDALSSIADLKGSTVYMTGKGTTPEYVVNYLLAKSGLSADDVNLQFKSEATEVVSLLAQDSSAIGILPQPFATAACVQNPELQTVLDLTEQWDRLNQDSGSMLVTGVTIVRSQFLEEHEAAVTQFLADHKASAAYTQEHPQEAAELIAGQGIVEKAAIAEKALPYCNIVCITGSEMETALSGYLQVLFDQDAKSVGGQLPDSAFYYIP